MTYFGKPNDKESLELGVNTANSIHWSSLGAMSRILATQRMWFPNRWIKVKFIIDPNLSAGSQPTVGEPRAHTLVYANLLSSRAGCQPLKNCT